MISVTRADLGALDIGTVLLVDTEEYRYKFIIEENNNILPIKCVTVSMLNDRDEERLIGTFIITTLQVGKIAHGIGIPVRGPDNMILLGSALQTDPITRIEVYSSAS